LRLLDLAPVARETLVEQLQDGVIVTDDQNRIVDINPAARAFSEQPKRVWIGEALEAFFPAGTSIPVAGHAQTPLEIGMGRGQPRHVELRSSPLRSRPGQPGGQLIILRNITQRKQAEEELQQANLSLQEQIEEITRLKDQMKEQAIRDRLTGLYNRYYMDEALNSLIAQAQQEDRPVSLLMMDIDHFKNVNDAYGHLFGDKVLQHFGRLLLRETRREDVVCRFGGEEFAIILPNTLPETALRRAEEIRLKCETFQSGHGSEPIWLSVSIGVAAFPWHGASLEQLLQAADEALYQAKLQGRNRVVLFSPPNTFAS
ncbi:MAG: GGDEF domain-containing protein, partial [Chloroflexi bacterium]|nr:GGDEF domain-containing protein [Chloroflexota bacterium]